MKRLIYGLAVAGMLAACNQQEPPADGAGATPDRATRHASPATRGALETPLFGGYEPQFEYELRADKVSTNKSGQRVRRVVLEYIGMERSKLIVELDHELALQGYAGKPWQQEAQQARTQYVKKGSPRVGVTITPASSALPTRSPDAEGFVKFVWIEGTP